MKKKQVELAYFDNAATTPLDKRVLQAMLPYMQQDTHFANASSKTHTLGTQASEAVELARRQMARSIGATPREIIWTSGATEANNLAILGGFTLAGKRIARRIITCKTEHKAVLEPIAHLQNEGIEQVFIPVRSSGHIDLAKLEQELALGALGASFMLVNNETGLVHQVLDIVNLCNRHNVPLHIDATQALGKIEVNLRKVRATYMSFSAHKFHGPKGIGALFVRRGAKIAPLVTGGGQENGIRPGTLPVHQIVGMGEASMLATKGLAQTTKSIQIFHDQLLKACSKISGCKVNGDRRSKVPHILNLSFSGIKGEELLHTLAEKFALSNGAACTTAKVEASHVLRAMGITRNQALASIRISMSRFNTQEEVQELTATLPKIVRRLSN